MCLLNFVHLKKVFVYFSSFVQKLKGKRGKFRIKTIIYLKIK